MARKVTLSSHGNIDWELQLSAATARAPKGKPLCATVENCPARAGAGPAPRNTPSTGPTSLHLPQRHSTGTKTTHGPLAGDGVTTPKTWTNSRLVFFCPPEFLWCFPLGVLVCASCPGSRAARAGFPQAWSGSCWKVLPSLGAHFIPAL